MVDTTHGIDALIDSVGRAKVPLDAQGQQDPARTLPDGPRPNQGQDEPDNGMIANKKGENR
jgi:hypothetical protein